VKGFLVGGEKSAAGIAGDVVASFLVLGSRKEASKGHLFPDDIEGYVRKR